LILPIPLTKENADIFLQQARKLTQLVHPHILRLVDVGVENFVPFMVMEYVSHIPLRQLYKSEQQPLDKLLPYLKQAVTALQYAHDQEIPHKNVREFAGKPLLAHSIAQAVFLGLLIAGGMAIYGLLLALFGVVKWADAVSAVRQTTAPDLRD